MITNYPDNKFKEFFKKHKIALSSGAIGIAFALFLTQCPSDKDVNIKPSKTPSAEPSIGSIDDNYTDNPDYTIAPGVTATIEPTFTVEPEPSQIIDTTKTPDVDQTKNPVNTKKPVPTPDKTNKPNNSEIPTNEPSPSNSPTTTPMPSPAPSPSPTSTPSDKPIHEHFFKETITYIKQGNGKHLVKYTYTCDGCGMTKVQSIVGNCKNTTLYDVDDNLEYYYCNDCKDSFTKKHNYGNKVTTSTGYTETCKNCGHIHEYKKPVTPDPTPTRPPRPPHEHQYTMTYDDEFETYTCKDKDHSYKVAHKFGAPKVTTSGNKVIETYTCSNGCGYSYTKTNEEIYTEILGDDVNHNKTSKSKTVSSLGTILEDKSTTVKVAHKYGAIENMTESGYEKTCSECNHKFTHSHKYDITFDDEQEIFICPEDEFRYTKNHKFSSPIVTTNSDGSTEKLYNCTNECGYWYKETYKTDITQIPNDDKKHKVEETKTTETATGRKETETIRETTESHSYGEYVTNSTGYTETCDICAYNKEHTHTPGIPKWETYTEDGKTYHVQITSCTDSECKIGDIKRAHDEVCSESDWEEVSRYGYYDEVEDADYDIVTIQCPMCGRSKEYHDYAPYQTDLYTLSLENTNDEGYTRKRKLF